MKKRITIFVAIYFILYTLYFIPAANAICPVCTIAVGAGIGLSRWLGIDDTITGLWIGGLTISLILWTLNWLRRKEINFKGKRTLVFLGYYLIIIVPLYWMNIIGHPFNKMLGIDKLLFGIILGSLAFWSGGIAYYRIKERNDGRAHFPFQKILMPLAPLIILSIILYFFTK